MNLPEGFELIQEDKKLNLPEGFELVADAEPENLTPEPVNDDLSSLLEFGSSDGLSELFGDGEGFLDGQMGGNDVSPMQLLKDAAAQTFTLGSKARIDGIEKRFPQLNIERIENGENAIITNPSNGKRVIANKEGLSIADALPIVGATAASLPIAKVIGLAKTVGGKVLTAAAGAGAADGALQGAEQLQGSGQDYDYGRTGTAAVLGGGLQKAGSVISQSLENGAVKSLIKKAAPSIDAIKDKARGLYNQVDEAGVTLKPQAFNGLLSKLSKTADDFNFIPENEPRAAAAMNSLASRADKSMTFSEIDNLRRVLSNAASGAQGSDAALSNKLLSVLDSSLDNIPDSALVANSKMNANQASGLLKEARTEWAKTFKTDIIKKAVDAGEIAASGSENGIRNEMRSIGKRIAKGTLKGFSEDEAQIIRQAAEGKGNLANLKRLIGKGAFGGDGSANVIGGTIGATVSNALGGPLAMMGQQVVSGASKKAAAVATAKNAQFADAVVRAGKNSLSIARAYVKTVPKRQRSPEGLAEILKQQGANADDLINNAEKFGGSNKQMLIDTVKILLSEKAAS